MTVKELKTILKTIVDENAEVGINTGDYFPVSIQCVSVEHLFYSPEKKSYLVQIYADDK